MQTRIVVMAAPVHDCRYPIILDPVRKRVSRASLQWMLNPSDILAMEQALRIKDQHRECRVTVVSIAPPQAETALRECLAAGADDVVRLWQDSCVALDCHGTATVLAKTIRNWSFSLVLMGWRRADLEFAQTGPALAELLDLPQITCARNLEPSPDFAQIRVEKRAAGWLLRLSCALPALITVDRGPVLRYPRFPDRRRAWRKPIEVLDLRCIGMNAAPEPLVAVQRFTPPKPRRRSTLGAAAEVSAAARIQRIMAGGAQTKKESTLRPCPDRVSTLNTVQYMLQEKLVVLP